MWGYPDEIPLPSQALTQQTNGAYSSHAKLGEGVGGLWRADRKEGSECVYCRGHKTPNLWVFPSFANSRSTSITSESLAGSEQTNTAGSLSSSVMQSLGRRKDGCNPRPGQAPHLGTHAHRTPIPAMLRGCFPGPFFTPCKAHPASCLPSLFAGRRGKGRRVWQI